MSRKIKEAILFLFIQSLCLALVFSQSLPLDEMGKPFFSPNLIVHWKTSKNIFPRTVSIYRLQPTRFSPVIISNLMAIGKLTASDQTISNANEMVFESRDKSRTLRINSLSGQIDYTDSGVVHGGITNVSVGVPAKSELLGLTTNLLPELGLKVSDIKKSNDNEPEFNFDEPEFTTFYLNSVLVTNIPQRSVFFRRALDGGSFFSNDESGNGWIYFASHKAISRISLKWPLLKRYKSFPTVDSKTIEKWIRDGKARHAPLPMDIGEIDWRNAKSMTIEKAEICYFTEKNYVYPIASFWTIVDTGYGKINAEIECPIFDETNMRK